MQDKNTEAVESSETHGELKANFRSLVGTNPKIIRKSSTAYTMDVLWSR
jgi:hypothetical protein